DFVLDDFDAGARADDDVAFLDGSDAADVDAHGRVKLEGAAAGGGFGIAEHDANFFADLIDENQAGTRFGDGSSEFAKRLGHEARLQAHVGVAHLAVEFRFGNEGGYGIDDEDVDGAGADEGFGDLEGLFAVVGLGDEEVVDIDAEFPGVLGVERVLGIDESGEAAGFLGFGDDLEG